MIKHIVAACTCLLAVACTANESYTRHPEVSTDSLRVTLKKELQAYAPGLGEIMGGIQTHHAKLWYAGLHANWALAQYESDELKERFEQAIRIESDRPEVKMIPMMYPAIDSMNKAIAGNNRAQFQSAYRLLTTACNSCHAANKFAFNVITIPTAPPVSNQDFNSR